MRNKYNYDFYVTRDKDTSYAANKILDIMKDYIEISSAVDVGGGVGTWLKAIQEMFGCQSENLHLLEGDYLQEDLLQIDKQCYTACNLEKRISTDRRYDIAITLEVAEHLSEHRAKTFCEDLTLLSNIILFAAAVPFQGGVGHINEQELTYWIKIFSEYNYVAFDIIRPQIQADTNIPIWYRQNMVVFAKKDSPEYEKLLGKMQYQPPLNMVSYELYLPKAKMCNRVQSMLMYKIYRFMKQRLKRQ